MKRRVLLIGLDCAAPSLAFERFVDQLPTIRGLMNRGLSGVLRSCDPPITVPAWSVMFSSRDPGTLGVYGFRNRVDRSYDRLSYANSNAIGVPRVWDILSEAGRDVVVLGVPGTYPPPAVRGALVSCFLTPDTRRSTYTHPPELKDEIERVIGDYMVDVQNFRTTDKQRLLDDVVRMTQKRFQLAEHLLSTRPWDFFAMVEIGTDRIQHGFWRYMDERHWLHEASPFATAIEDYYILLDDLIGRLLRHADDQTAVMIVSDHGAKRMDGAIAINEWLRQTGYLVLRDEVSTPTPFTLDLVDWKRTAAWGEGGYYGRLFINVEGREPEGIVHPRDYERVREELVAGLEALGDETGQPIGTQILRPEDVYEEVNGVPPDLLVYFGDLHWRSAGTIGAGVHLRENDTGPDDANHAHEGLYVLTGPGFPARHGEERHIGDVAPTILGFLGVAPPASMQGASMQDSSSSYTPAEEALIAQRLADLGYL